MPVLQRSALPAHFLAAKAEPVDDQQILRIALMLAPRCGSEALVARALALGRQALGQRTYMDSRSPDLDVCPADEALAAVRVFCEQNGFRLVRTVLGGLFASVAGKAGDLAHAFGVTLRSYRYGDATFRGYDGCITLPDVLAPHVQGVLGLDDIGRALHLRQMREDRMARTADDTQDAQAPRPKDKADATLALEPPSQANNLPTTVAFDYYDYPSTWTGKGATVAFLETDLGIEVDWIQAYFKSLEVGPVDIELIYGMDGTIGPSGPVATSAPTSEPAAPINPPEPPPMKPIINGEAMMDLKITGSVAPGAQLVAYSLAEHYGFVQDDPWVDALLAVLVAPAHPCQVMSISLGRPESDFTPQVVDAIQAIFAVAALSGVTVCIASGDFGAVGRLGGALGGKYQQNCAFPASSPLCLACGGTELVLDPPTEPGHPPALQDEVAWNSMQYAGDKAGTGGGISMLFPVPDYQQAYTLPAPQNTNENQGPGRGVPDVAANASPDSGYALDLNHTGKSFGTSAAAPMWAALVALLVEGNGGKPIGLLNYQLYNLNLADVPVCTPILLGDNIAPDSNIGFPAGAPWNACCGLGSPLGTNIAKALGLDVSGMVI